MSFRPTEEESEAFMQAIDDQRGAGYMAGTRGASVAAGMGEVDRLVALIKKVTDLWDEPLDEVHDIPQIAHAIVADGWRSA